LVFIQRTRASGPLLRQLEFQHIQPDADPAYWLENVWKKSSPDQKSQLRGEFLRNARLHPGSRRVRRWLDLIDGLV